MSKRISISLEEKKRRHRDRMRAFGRANPEYGANLKLKKNYGITLKQYNEWNEAFNKVCHICEKPCPSKRRLAVDHNHETGLVRGLLCINCNKGLGNFKDNIKLFEKAIIYLNEAKETQEYVNAVNSR